MDAKWAAAFGVVFGMMCWNGVAEETNYFLNAFERADGSKAVEGEGGWFYSTAELRFLSRGEFWGEAALDAGLAKNPAHRDPLGPIDDFNRQLLDFGAHLLVVPIPSKALVYPVPLGCSREDSLSAVETLRKFYAELRDREIDVLDLTDDFIAADALEGGALFCRTANGLSGVGIERTAERIAAHIEKNVVLPPNEGVLWELASRTVKVHGDLARILGDDSEEEIVLNDAVAAGGQSTIQKTSPVLLLGGEEVLAYHDPAKGEAAGLADHLAARLARTVDLIGVNGSAATASRIALMREMNASESYITEKRVIIWCFSAEEFTQADVWRFVPLPLH